MNKELPDGFREIAEFPDYMVSMNGEVRNIRFNKNLKVQGPGALHVHIRKDGKSYERIVHNLLRVTFPEFYPE